MNGETPLWSPTAERSAATHMERFRRQINQRLGLSLNNFAQLHDWSVREPGAFWTAIWEYADIQADVRGETPVENAHAMPGARWFPDARLNFAANLLRGAGPAEQAASDPSLAILARDETGRLRSMTRQVLYAEVRALARGLRSKGVQCGDRVAGFLPNIPEAVTAMLATSSLGAVWSSCSPDFGINGVYDRFGQIEPKVLFTADGYRYAGREHDSLDTISELAARLTSLNAIIIVPFIGSGAALSGPARELGIAYSDWIAADDALMAQVGMATARPEADAAPSAAVTDEDVMDAAVTDEDVMDAAVTEKAVSAEAVPSATVPSEAKIDFVPLPFDHPLYIMFSSGTTGKPKCIVHGAGGTLLQHAKEHLLHVDVQPGDRLFFFTTCGWMMWNWMVSALASRATLLLYDGSPFHPDGNTLFDFAEESGMTQLGTSAKFIDACSKAGLSPRNTHTLPELRSVLSTGSPLVPESFDYVYSDIASDICLSSMSGGTDIISCFVLGNPAAPVYRGELQCKGLGMDVQVFGEDGKPVARGEKGELVCTNPFPSMPIGFFGDTDGSRYRAAYFEKFDRVWCHGDYVAETASGGMVIFGRSDAVLNPGGVRIGTAEIYRQVESFDEILESLVIGQQWQGDVRVVLFVRLRESMVLDDALRDRIRRHIRTRTTPRHVPARIVQVADIPRTRSGKIVELAVRKVVHGERVDNVEALANPDALALFDKLPELDT